MRPVNLIPPDLRRGDSAPTRTGPLAYMVVAALGAVLVAVLVVVMLGNSAADKRTEVASLEAQAAQTEARATALSPYVSFQSLRDARVQTVDSLAKSRFDWERVIRELSRVIPSQVSLNNMTGTISPDVTIDDGAGIALRGSVAGPAVELKGCARSQDDIARLIAAVNDVDGVTRVTAVNGIKADGAGGEDSGGGAEGASSSGGCAAKNPSFELVAAFDAVPVPAGATDPGTVVAPGGATPTASSPGAGLTPGG